MSINGLDQPEWGAFAVPVEPDQLRALRVFLFVQPASINEGGVHPVHLNC